MAGLNIVNLSGQFPYLQKGTLSGAPQGLIVHHTASSDNATPQSIAAGWKSTGTSAQYIMGRDGTIYQMMPDNAKAYQIKSSWNPAIPWASNSTTQGIELIAKDDKDVTPAQVAALQQFALQQAQTYGYDPATHVVGHGEVNGSAGLNGKTRADGRPDNEGMTAVAALRNSLNGKGPNPIPPMNVPEVGTALAYTGANPPLPRVDPRSALGAIGAATQPSLANWFANGPDRAQVMPASTDVASLYNGILPPQGARFGGDAGLALGLNPALEAEAQAATNPPKFGVTQTFPNGVPTYSLPPQPNSSGSPDDRDQSLSAILAQAATGNTIPSQPYPQAASGNTIPSRPYPAAATGNTTGSQPIPQAATGNTYISQPAPQAATGNTIGYQPGAQAATGNTVASQPPPLAATGNTVPSVPVPVAATGLTVPSPVQPYAGYIPGLGGGQTSPSTTVPLPRPDPRGMSAKQYLGATPAQPTGQSLPDPTPINTPYDVNFAPSSTMLGGVSKMTPPAALQGVANVLGGLGNWFAGQPAPGSSQASPTTAVPQSSGPAGGYYAPPPVPQTSGPAGGSYSAPYDVGNSWTKLLMGYGQSLGGTSSMAMNDPAGVKNTRLAPVATTIMVPIQTLNPDYTKWLNSQGAAINGVEGVDTPKLDENGNVVLPSSYLGAPPPKYITQHVAKTTYTTPPQALGQRPIIAQPVVQPQMTLIQKYQTANPTASPSQAYNAVGAQAIQQAQQPNGPVYAAITGNSGSGQIRGGAIA